MIAFFQEIPVSLCQPGYYTLAASVANKISAADGIIEVGVEYPINNTVMDVSRSFYESEAVNITFTQGGGMPPNMAVVDCDFGDGNSLIGTPFEVAPEGPFQIIHTYAYGDYIVSCNASNNVSSVQFTQATRVGVNMTGVAITTPRHNLKVNEEISFLVSSEKGSAVTYEVDFGDGTSSGYVSRNQTDFNKSDTTYITKSYSTPGEYTVTVTGSNHFHSAVVTLAGTVSVQHPITSMRLVTPSPIAVPPGLAYFNLSTPDPGPTDVKCNWTFGDGSKEESSAVELINAQAHVVTHTYTDPMTVDVNVTCWNKISSGSATVTLQLEVGVAGMKLTCEQYVELQVGKTDIILGQEQTERWPSNCMIEADFGNGNTVAENLPASRQDITYNQAYSNIQKYYVTCNISNAISYQEIKCELDVVERIEGYQVEISLTDKMNYPNQLTFATGQTLDIQATTTAGSNETYTIKRDGIVVQQSTEKQQTLYLSSTGTFVIEVEASNPINTLTDTRTITVVDPVTIVSFTHNETIMANYTSYFSLLINKALDSQRCVYIRFNSTENNEDLEFYFAESTTACQQYTGVAPPSDKFTTVGAVNTVSFYQFFGILGPYDGVVTLFTEHGKVILNNPFSVNKIPCNNPVLEALQEVGSTFENPVEAFKSENLIIDGNYYKTTIECQISKIVAQKWRAYSLSSSATSKELNIKDAGIDLLMDGLQIPKATLPYGMYKAGVTIYMYEYPEMTSTHDIYFRIKGTPLVATISKGLSRDIGLGRLLEVDGRESRDLDENIDQDQGLTCVWYCRRKSDNSSVTPPTVAIPSGGQLIISYLILFIESSSSTFGLNPTTVALELSKGLHYIYTICRGFI